MILETLIEVALDEDIVRHENGIINDIPTHSCRAVIDFDRKIYFYEHFDDKTAVISINDELINTNENYEDFKCKYSDEARIKGACRCH